jgi:hypothetical protein
VAGRQQVFLPRLLYGLLLLLQIVVAFLISWPPLGWATSSSAQCVLVPPSLEWRNSRMASGERDEEKSDNPEYEGGEG